MHPILRENEMACITLLTDFGLEDGNVGVMKGVILGIAPDVTIIDLSHEIPPQDILSASFVLDRGATYFPEGTVHVVVVDPGVGTKRRAIAGRLGAYWFVGPDNGVITRLLERAERESWSTEFVHLDEPRYWLPEVSDVFHGRDIFAPVAAHLTEGVELQSMGIEITDVVRLPFPEPRREGHTMIGEVIYIDHFGNVTTNLRQSDLEGRRVLEVSVCDSRIPGLVRTFGEQSPGTVVALFSSTGDLILSVVNGNAADRLSCEVGEEVVVLMDN